MHCDKAMHKIHDAKRYFLYSHVSVCSTGDYVVFLDGNKNRYFGASAADAKSLGQFIEGWPWGDSHTPVDYDSLSELLADMLASGMITEHRTDNAPVKILNIEPPKEPLLRGYSDMSCRIRAKDILLFLRSALRAARFMRNHSFEEISRSRRRLRSISHIETPDAACHFDLDLMRNLVARFSRVYSFFFTTHDSCLFRSLALSEFLAHHGIFPQCIIGVVTNPFSAHCWLQHAGIVVGDTPETVCQFTPVRIL